MLSGMRAWGRQCLNKPADGSRCLGWGEFRRALPADATLCAAAPREDAEMVRERTVFGVMPDGERCEARRAVPL